MSEKFSWETPEYYQRRLKRKEQALAYVNETGRDPFVRGPRGEEEGFNEVFLDWLIVKAGL